MVQIMSYMKQNKTGNTTPEDHIAMAGLAYSYSMLSFASDISGTLWIIDTGASNHMCYDKSLLHNIHIISQPFQIFFA